MVSIQASPEAGKRRTGLAVCQCTSELNSQAMFCMSALQNAVVFGVGFPSMKTGVSRSFSGLPTVSAGKWLSLD